MTEPLPLRAEFCDVRPIKSRKVMQLIFEVPIEGADNALAVLGGFPRPDQSRWVGIVCLNAPDVLVTPDTRPPADVPPPPTRWNDLPLPQRAALLCKAPEFWTFLNVDDESAAVMVLRQRCGVVSRADIKREHFSGEIYLAIEAAYFATKLTKVEAT